MNDFLMNRRRIMLGMEREPYIVFADPVVEQICATNWGNGIGVTPSWATRATSLGLVFRGNTSIVSFDEMEQFGFTEITGGSNTGATTQGAFGSCTSLVSVTPPNTLTSVGAYAFYGCSNLESFVFPTGQVTLGQHAFNGCSKLEDVGKPKVSSLGSSCNRLFYQCAKLPSLDLSESTFTSFPSASASGNRPFYGCSSLALIILPTTCTTIGNYVFYGVVATSITGLNNITSIGTGAFRTAKITEIVLPNIITINKTAFYQCTSLSSVDIGSTCTSIGTEVFRNCSSLRTFICRATTPPTLGTNNFVGVHSSFKIYVPYSIDHSVLTAYQTDWSAYSSDINELDSNGNIPT